MLYASQRKWTKILYSYSRYAFPLLHAVPEISALYSWSKGQSRTSHWPLFIFNESACYLDLEHLRVHLEPETRAGSWAALLFRKTFLLWMLVFVIELKHTNRRASAWLALHYCIPFKYSFTLVLVLELWYWDLFWQGKKSHHVCFNLPFKYPCSIDLHWHSPPTLFYRAKLGWSRRMEDEGLEVVACLF